MAELSNETRKATTVFNIKFNPTDENEIQLVENDDETEPDSSAFVINDNLTVQNEDDDESVEEVLEHICGKCKRSYKSFYALKKHIEKCKHTKLDKLIDEDYEELTMSQIVKLQKTAKSMAKQNICFCCEESLETAHTGHIRCQECPKSFKSAQTFQRHMSLLHSSSSKYPCTVCNAKCPTNTILQLHNMAHETGKPFACQKCGKDFTRRYHLQRHQEHSNCDPTKQKPAMNCKVCGKGFFRIDNLRNHLRGHIGDNPRPRDYQCPYCEKAFFGTTTMNIHIRTHTGERPFMCDLCQKGFPSNGALRKHRRSHTGEKPFQCTVCERAFAAKEVLNRHMKTHTGERPHVCGKCGKKFIQATQLKAHMFHHTGEHGYPCKKCGMQFNRKIRLTEHFTEFHVDDENILDCKSCKLTFPIVTELLEHMDLHESTRGFKCRSCKKKFLNAELHTFCADCKECKDFTEENVPIHEHEPATKPYVLFVKPRTVISGNYEEASTSEDRRKIKILTSKPKVPIKSNDSENESEISAKSEAVSPKLNSRKARTRRTTNIPSYIDDSDEMEFDEDVRAVSPKVNNRQARTTTNIPSYVDDSDEMELNENIKDEMELDQDVKDAILDESEHCNIILDDKMLKNCVSKLLNLLLDKELLTGFGWPSASVEHVLSAVIKQCGHEPADYDSCSDYTTKIRENVKLLFTVVIDNDSFKHLLNNHTIDEVILQILQMTD